MNPSCAHQQRRQVRNRGEAAVIHRSSSIPTAIPNVCITRKFARAAAAGCILRMPRAARTPAARATQPSSPWTHLVHPFTALVCKWELDIKQRTIPEMPAWNCAHQNPEAPLKSCIGTVEHCIITKPRLEKHEGHGGSQCPRNWKALLATSSHRELQSRAGSPNAKNHPEAGAQLHHIATTVCH